MGVQLLVQPTQYFTGGCSFEPIAGMECQSGSTQKNEKMKCHSGFPKCHMATACIKQIADEMPFLASAPYAIPFTSSKQVLQTVLYFGSWAAALPLLYGFLVSKLSCWFWRRRKNGSSWSFFNWITTSPLVGLWPCIRH